MTSRPRNIRLRETGKLAKTTYVNEVADAVNRFPVGLAANAVAGGALFRFMAKVVTAGPGGEADYTDERYWVEPQVVTNDDATAAAETHDNHSLASDTIVTATNFGERPPPTGAGNGSHSLQENALVWVDAVLDDGDGTGDCKVRYVLSPFASNNCFPCDVTQTGGSAGNSTTYCSFTYTVKSVGGATTIGTAVAVTAGRARAVKCVCVAGTHGVAYYDDAGALKLWDVDETQTLKALDVVTGVTCNGDGTISVTTENVKVYGVDP